MQPIAVTGLGLCCAVGETPELAFDAICAGEDGLWEGPWPWRGWRVAALRERRSAAALAVQVASQALSSCASREMPVFCGTTAADLDTGERRWREDRAGRVVNPDELLRPQLPDAPARAVADALELRGHCVGVSTACTASAVALGMAAQWILAGRGPRALVLGVETLSQSTRVGFGSLGLQAEGRCRPFDARRSGLNLGEGAAALLLESAAAARDRGVEPRGWLLGYGHRSDAWHPTAPHPEGRGLREAIAEALGEHEPPSWVLAHGTGTVANDAVEAAVLGELLPGAAITGIKGSLGHTLGAAGAIEAVLTLLGLGQGRLPPCTGLGEPAFPLDFVRLTRELRSPTALSVNLAFGGSNTALLFGGPTWG